VGEEVSLRVLRYCHLLAEALLGKFFDLSLRISRLVLTMLIPFFVVSEK
jgi:hypothetical protein